MFFSAVDLPFHLKKRIAKLCLIPMVNEIKSSFNVPRWEMTGPAGDKPRIFITGNNSLLINTHPTRCYRNHLQIHDI
jgi:hypothetical protein